MFLTILCIATLEGMHIQTHRLLVGKYEAHLYMVSVAIKFHKDWYRHSIADKDDTQTQTGWSHKATLIFIKMKKVG
jgi:hypothetical protein